MTESFYYLDEGPECYQNNSKGGDNIEESFDIAVFLSFGLLFLVLPTLAYAGLYTAFEPFRRIPVALVSLFTLLVSVLMVSLMCFSIREVSDGLPREVAAGYLVAASAMILALVALVTFQRVGRKTCFHCCGIKRKKVVVNISDSKRAMSPRVVAPDLKPYFQVRQNSTSSSSTGQSLNPARRQKKQQSFSPSEPIYEQIYANEIESHPFGQVAHTGLPTRNLVQTLHPGLASLPQHITDDRRSPMQHPNQFLSLPREATLRRQERPLYHDGLLRSARGSELGIRGGDVSSATLPRTGSREGVSRPNSPPFISHPREIVLRPGLLNQVRWKQLPRQ